MFWASLWIALSSMPDFFSAAMIAFEVFEPSA